MELLYPKELLKTNDPPSDEIVRRVKAYLHTAQPIMENTVKEAEKELEQLEYQLEEMHEKLREHKASLTKYEAILSPSRRIPIDILHHIFYHCLPIHRNSIMSAYEAPMLLTQVCSTWRAVAFSSPRLWSKIRISFAYNSASDVDYQGAAIDGDKILRMRCNAVKEWLDRSGSCPLSISVYHSGTEEWPLNEWPLNEDNVNEESAVNTLEPFKTIVDLCHRWEEIELVMSSEVYLRFEDMVSVADISALKTLRISLNQRYGSSEQEWDGPGSCLLMAPNIREVSLGGNRIRLWRPTMAPWTHLTNFSCRTPSSLYDCFELLSKGQNLVRCTIRLLSFELPMETLQFHGTAFLPHLQTLVIIGNPSQRQATAKFLSRINAPKLIHIGYEVPDIYILGGFQLENAPFPFLLLLEVSTIRSLTIDPRHISANIDELATILRLSKGVTDLFVGHRTTSHSGLDHKPLASFNYLGLFRLLTIDTEVVSPDNEVILPNLQVFSASVNYSISKDSVLRFIDSRSVPSSPLGTAVLKSVNIAFSQRRNDDYQSQESFIHGVTSGIQYLIIYTTLMEDNLEDLFKHNNPPPEEIIPSVKDLLIAGQRVSEEMQDKMNHLSDLIDEVYAKILNSQNSLQDYEFIASPARRLLPSNVLRRIFYHCLPTYRNPSMRFDEAPMLLTSVCSAWRSVALSYPRLWSKIYITFTYSPPYMRAGTSVEDVEHMMELRCAAVKTWLDRSGSYPLSISIQHTGTQGWLEHELENDLDNQPLEATTQNLFEIVTALSHRWEDVELIMPSEVYFKLEPMIQADRLLALKYARLSLDPSFHRHYYENDAFQASWLLKTSNLRILALSRMTLCIPMPAIWTDLTYFSCHYSTSIKNAFALLLACPSLVHCNFSINDSPPLDMSTFERVATLPHLRSLSIAGAVWNRSAIAIFLDHVDAPKLIQISHQYLYDFGYMDPVEETVTIDPFPWLSLFKASKIQKLSVDPRLFSRASDELPEIFRALTCLTELVIAQGFELTRAMRHYYSPISYYPRKNYDYLTVFNLLTIDSEATSDKEIFLPNLEVFQASVNNTVTQDIVYQFVTSRMNPSSTQGVQIIKHVNIALETSEHKRDLKDDIDLYGKQIGVHTQAIIVCHNPPRYYHSSADRFSPRHGLTTNEDLSWMYRDDVLDDD
ncbi:hypothetical protein CVT25_002859 [Psilocybe cyanescens]|uniref:Uncharacterized protein n=1 Tax=Psilocybe cyanescens TaxID=93625 RepID=A0A409WKS1_PSICY|nr:hypothetical protein CVT25_002859 [Psilocybe cyanescens]